MRFAPFRLVRFAPVLVGLLAVAPAAAQTSTSYKMQDTIFNNGGNPGNAGPLTSAHFHVKLDALGDAAASGGLTSASFHLDGGFLNPLQPPGEVTGLRFTTPSFLTWDRRPSAQWYDVYRGDLSAQAPTFGTCWLPHQLSPGAFDGLPPPGSGRFYLVTAANAFEEGTKGFTSSGTERANSLPCP